MSLFAALLLAAGTNAPPPYAPSFDPGAFKSDPSEE